MSMLTKFAVILFVFNCVESNKVPLLLWTNIREFSCDKNSQGLTESVSSYFTNEYMDCLSTYQPDNVLLFIYDKLGIEDISLYGQADMKDNAFANIYTMQKRLISTTLPEVEPSNIVEDLFQKFHDASNNAKIKVVRLPPIDRSNAKSTVAGLQQLDRRVLEDVKAIKGTYFAIVTSENSLDNIVSRYARDTVGRQLLANDDDKKNQTTLQPVYLVSPCLYLTFLSANITVNQKKPSVNTYKTNLILKNNHTGLIDITNDTVCLPNKNTTGNVSVTLQFRGTTDVVQDVSMRMDFNKNEKSADGSRWWKLLGFYLNITVNKTAANNVYLKPDLALNPRLFKDIITAPDNMSFACAQTSGLSDLTAQDDINATVYVEFKKFQVQPFGVNASAVNATFNQAVDCTGWYTGPIWSGLIVTLLLLTVLAYGLAMLSKVTTMDRFDDPKGKTISVPQENT